MGFYKIDKPRKSQVSLSSFTDSVKDDVRNVGELAKGTVKTVGKTAVRAVKTVGDAYGMSSNNKDLKTSMRGHSGFHDRTRNDD